MAGPIPLKEALTRYLPPSEARRYEKYRTQAKTLGFVRVGQTRVPAEQIGGRWVVAAGAFSAAALAAAEAEQSLRREIAQTDLDYAAHKVRPGIVKTSWGGYNYTASDGFHFAWSTYEQARERSNGAYVCNACWKPASTENEREECHRCSNWGPCGADCTLSRVFCGSCGESMPIDRAPNV